MVAIKVQELSLLKDLRRRFNRFCFQYRDKGIPNLMLYITLGCVLVYLMTQFTQNPLLYSLLVFDRTAILSGQIWRLITYPFTFYHSNLLLMAVALFCYYSLGRAIESIWGTLRFNLFYLCGILMMDIWCMIFGGRADVTYLNLSLFLSYATMFPDARFLLFFIIPIKAWIFAIFNLLMVVYNLIVYPFPYNFFSIISLANYFLFFGKDVLNVIPGSWRIKIRRLFTKNHTPRKQERSKVIPFSGASASAPRPTQNYTHRCTVCGRTDVSNPELEFRYCSRCNGYYCYCEDHINNHSHIE